MLRDLRPHSSQSSYSVEFRSATRGTARFAQLRPTQFAEDPRSGLTNLGPQTMMCACGLEPATTPRLFRNVLGFGQLKKRSMSSRPCLESCSCLSSSACLRNPADALEPARREIRGPGYTLFL